MMTRLNNRNDSDGVISPAASRNIFDQLRIIFSSQLHPLIWCDDAPELQQRSSNILEERSVKSLL